MNKPKDELIELADTINDTPTFIFDNTTPTYTPSRFTEHQNKTEENIYSNIDKNLINDVKKKQENRIYLQRENRRIISLIKKIINKKRTFKYNKIINKEYAS